MPIYTYHCEMCQMSFDKIVTVERRDLESCSCGRKLVRKPQVGAVYAKTCGKGLA